MGVSKKPAGDRSMLAFRRRIDAFFGHPRAAELAARLEPPSPPPPTTATAALRSRLNDALTRLGAAPPAGEVLRLRRSLTMHDGRVVAMTGDRSPLGPDEGMRIVTTTTTVQERNRLRSETTVLVFERGSR